MGWRYFATRLNGDGTETPLHQNLPLHDPEIERVLSGPGGVAGRLDPELEHLKTTDDGAPVFVPWSTAIYAEADGVIRGAGILVGLTENGPALDLDAAGFTYYPAGQPHTDEHTVTGEDVCDTARHIWAHLQGQPGGNLGLTIDPALSGVTVGTAEEPFTLGWWQTADLGKEFDDLAKRAPFDYLTDHWWEGDTIRHHLRLGVPALGARRQELRFVVGENIFTVPKIDHSGEEYADQVMVLGAGEGRKMVRGIRQRPSNGRLRRTVVVEDKAAQTETDAARAAADELAYRLGDPDLSSFTVTEHPNAPAGSFDVGDEILVTTAPGWGDGLNLWVRILAMTTRPGTGVTSLTVARVEKV